MSLNYSDVRLVSNGEPIDQFVLNRPVQDLAEAIHHQMYNKTEVDNHKWDADATNSGIFNRGRLASENSSEMVKDDLVPLLRSGDDAKAQWQSFSTILARYAAQIGANTYAYMGNIYTSPTNNDNGGRQGLQLVAATYSGAPVGMIVGYRTSYTTTYYHNATSYYDRVGTFIAFKISGNDWYHIILDAPVSTQERDPRWDK